VSAGGTSQPPQTAVAVAATPARQDDRSDKQKALAEQAQRLVDMATELKVDVDKTNKNILSLDVVRKAEEIEALAHRMKEESKR
jgi:7-keto-8-aminopelargonate synthetase-like enzyme